MRSGTKRKQIRTATFLFAVLLILGAVTPIAPIIVWLLPAPLLYLWLHGERSRAIILCLTTVIVTIFGGSLEYLSIPVIVSGLIAGFVGEAWKRGQFPVSPLAAGTLLLIGLSIFSMGIAFWGYGYSLPNELGNQVQHAVVQEMSAIHPKDAASFTAMANDYQVMIKENFPAILIIVCFLIVFFNVYLVRQRLFARNPEQFQKGSFADWTLPISTVWITMAAFLLSFIEWPVNYHIVQVMVENVQMVSSFFLALQGLSLIWRTISRYYIGRWAMLAVVVLSPIYLVWLLYIGLGFIDCLKRNRSKA